MKRKPCCPVNACSADQIGAGLQAAQVQGGQAPAQVAPYQPEHQFQHDEPDHAWVMDITNIRTHEGCWYLAAVLDLNSRAAVDWSMGSRMHTSLVLAALTMAVWRRKPKGSVIIHSDQGSQYGSDEFNR